MAATAPNGNDGLILVIGLAAIWMLTRPKTARAATTTASAGGVRPGVVPNNPSTTVNLLGQAINRLLMPVSMATAPINPTPGGISFGQAAVDSGLSETALGGLGFDFAAPADSGVPLLGGTQTYSDNFNWDGSLSFGL